MRPYLMQPADGAAGWRWGEEVIQIHVARAVAGFDPFRAENAAAPVHIVAGGLHFGSLKRGR
ncbi:MAG: hypothetical protein KJ077_51280 [Anaerolineae bacterium]|nr:hypothetical protein [Anaerolineae bacterium]